jgi:hypothetical protein
MKKILLIINSILLFGTACSNIPDYKKDSKLSWHAIGSGITYVDTVNDHIEAINIDANGNLYASGYFTTMSGVSANNIAKWNGNSWSSLGSGTTHIISNILCDTNGNIYAGGFLTYIGGISISKIAKWNGSAWSALGQGVYAPSATVYWVTASCFDSSGNIIVGGSFTDMIQSNGDMITVNKIARWNGSNWSSIGGGIGTSTGESVSCLISDGNGNIYAGGLFSTAGGVPANNIAKWNGSGWSALGDGMNNRVRTIYIDKAGILYAGGSFTTAGGVTAKFIAQWDGVNWWSCGTGISCDVESICGDSKGNVYAGGNFVRAGGKDTNYIAQWDGTSWLPLGSGMDRVVLKVYCDSNDNLYAGGRFRTADGNQVNGIARWGY